MAVTSVQAMISAPKPAQITKSREKDVLRDENPAQETFDCMSGPRDILCHGYPTFSTAYRPNAQVGYRLNINGTTGSSYQGRVVNLMNANTMGTDWNFLIGTRVGYTGYYMMVTANVNFTVNRSDNGGRAIIWPLLTESADSRLYDNNRSFYTG